MILADITLKGFRNYKDAHIKLEKNTLIIGANDVGKTNLIWAMRLLLDRSLSDYDIEPRSSDFYVLEETNSFVILLHFTDITEECVLSKLRGKISDANEMYMSYNASRDPNTGKISYTIKAGASVELLSDIEAHYYRKYLNIKYISCRRDLYAFISKERNFLFQNAKESRSTQEEEEDNTLLQEIKTKLQEANNLIPTLHYISKATNSINSDLKEMSIYNNNQDVYFDTNSSNIDKFIDSTSVSSKTNDTPVNIGGDGRLNQIYLSLWATKHEIERPKLEEVSIVCIEEPEAHLHPHQQQKLATYLSNKICGQIFLTSHSPQITSEFSPNSIVRLYKTEQSDTKAASNGCSKIIEGSIINFGYRMSIIPAEAFYADQVWLVEGISEVIFYKALSKFCGVDLLKNNISILMANGIGFSTFIKILNAMNIPWKLRTDNDIFKIPKKKYYRMAGMQRAISILEDYRELDASEKKIIEENKEKLKELPTNIPTNEINTICSTLRSILNNHGIFLSEKDLENDMFNSPIKNDLIEFFNDLEEYEIITAMQEAKGNFMYNFIRQKSTSLSKLKEHSLTNLLR